MEYDDPGLSLGGRYRWTHNGGNGFSTCRPNAGTNAIDLVNASVPAVDIGAYTGTRNSETTMAGYRSLLANPANWDRQDATGDNSIDGIGPDVPFNSTAFTVVPEPGATLPLTLVGSRGMLGFRRRMHRSILTRWMLGWRRMRRRPVSALFLLTTKIASRRRRNWNGKSSRLRRLRLKRSWRRRSWRGFPPAPRVRRVRPTVSAAGRSMLTSRREERRGVLENAW